jgi:DNA-binding FadR family transcriptional regulator
VSSSALRRPASYEGDTFRTYPAEVFEARLIIEPKIAALAALRATRQEVEDMQKSIARGNASESMSEFEKWDAVFHRIIVHAARNGLLASLYEGIHAVRAGNLWGKMKEQSLTSERMTAYIVSHQAILDAIKDRDSREAERTMYDHIIEAKTNILGPSI